MMFILSRIVVLICVLPFVASDTSVLRGGLKKDTLLSEQVEAATKNQTSTTDDIEGILGYADGQSNVADGIVGGASAAGATISGVDFDFPDFPETSEETTRELAGVPYSLTTVFMSTYINYPSGCANVAQKLTISCDSGGTIGVYDQPGNWCQFLSKESISCTKPASFPQGDPPAVTVWCTGKYGVRARLQPTTFNRCQRNSGAGAGQALFMVQYCQNGYFYSPNCVQAPTARGYFEDGEPYCYNGAIVCKAKTSSASTCSIATGEVRIGTSGSCFAPSQDIPDVAASWEVALQIKCVRECHIQFKFPNSYLPTCLRNCT